MSYVLVAYASKHGATAEIADAIAQELRHAGHTVACNRAEDVSDLAAYDAAVLGSAVYMGRWRRAARRLLQRASKELVARPIWLFSSGPCGQADPSWAAPPGLERRARRLGARGHVVFGGRVPPEPSNFIERAVTQKAPPELSDLRNWDVIRGWASEIASELSSMDVSGVCASR
jgi:menaquinone-dependent protoporphyrinogen oxidase